MRSAVQLWRKADYGLRSRQASLICSNQTFLVLLQKSFSTDPGQNAASVVPPVQTTLSVGDRVIETPLGEAVDADDKLSRTDMASASGESHESHGFAPPSPSHRAESSGAVRTGLPSGKPARGVTNFVRRSSKSTRFPVRISGIPRLLLMSDVLRFFRGCELKEDDVRVEYNSAMDATAMVAFFKSEELRSKALKRAAEFPGGRRISVDPLADFEAEQLISQRLARFSKGRYLLVIGVPDLSTTEDVLRFFTGFHMMTNPVTIVRSASAPIRGAGYRCVARFVSPEEAQRAVRTKHNSFIMDSRIELRVLA